MGWKTSALDLARRTGAIRAVGACYGRRRLTVLAYHRVADARDPDLRGFAGNVSASPAAFAEQMDWLAGHFEVVSLEDVLAWLDGEAALPDRPALITFDDGYRDNLEIAAPLLAERGLPATLFLATDPTDGGPSLCWDLAASLFENSEKDRAELPVLGRREWPSPAGRQHIIRDFVYAIKWLPPDRRTAILDELGTAIESDAPDRIPDLYLDWDDVRSLSGWSIGAHTVRHPVLTSVGLEEAIGEITDSARRITDETGRQVRALAYPNGLEGDYDDEIAAGAQAAGIDLAFTLRPGPARLREVRANPLAVRRVYIGFSDGLTAFSGKVMGAFRLLGEG